jgi:hypothetical protein
MWQPRVRARQSGFGTSLLHWLGHLGAWRRDGAGQNSGCSSWPFETATSFRRSLAWTIESAPYTALLAGVRELRAL